MLIGRGIDSACNRGMGTGWVRGSNGFEPPILCLSAMGTFRIPSRHGGTPCSVGGGLGSKASAKP